MAEREHVPSPCRFGRRMAGQAQGAADRRERADEAPGSRERGAPPPADGQDREAYTFDGPSGKVTLLDLFEGQRQLIVYHFMFDPAWEKGCPGCTGYVDALGDLSMLAQARYELRADLARAAREARGYKKPRAGSGRGIPRSAATSTTTSM